MFHSYVFMIKYNVKHKKKMRHSQLDSWNKLYTKKVKFIVMFYKKMTLFNSIYKKLASQSNESLEKYCSPPPEIEKIMKKKHKKRKFLYSHVKARVDSSAPRWSPKPLTNILAKWELLSRRNYLDNLQLVANLRKTSFQGGKVDCRRQHPLYYNKTYTNNRKNFYRKINRGNRLICKLLKESQCKVIPTTILERQWKENKRRIVDNASTKFVLFPITPKEDVEDISFLAPPGVKRPRVSLTLRLRGGAELGSLTVELFTDVAPQTCRLFTDLLDGDGRGHGYVGTQFFRKIPHLYWSGGDVIHDNGFGCYAQRGRRKPIPAENYHLPHSMPGLLSMRVTADDEVCGIFTITFKPLPQLDLKNVVFGRVVRPSRTFDAMRSLGSALSTHPQVEISATRRKSDGVWIHGAPNTKIHKQRM